MNTRSLKGEAAKRRQCATPEDCSLRKALEDPDKRLKRARATSLSSTGSVSTSANSKGILHLRA